MRKDEQEEGKESGKEEGRNTREGADDPDAGQGRRNKLHIMITAILVSIKDNILISLLLRVLK